MSIDDKTRVLLIDDSTLFHMKLKKHLNDIGITDISFAHSAEEAYGILENNAKEEADLPFDLILLDVIMDNIDGIEACKHIKADKRFSDIPIIMITASERTFTFASAFEAGAMDYISKPPEKLELEVRVNSALRLKKEMDTRKERESLLAEVNQKLKQLSAIDFLTGLANRRTFDEVLDKEWKRAQRNVKTLSLVMMDIDFFKNYNDGYGHQAGDNCLRQVANAIDKTIYRPADLAARYGGEEFILLLPETEALHAMVVANRVCQSISDLKLPHEYADSHKYVSISAGVATMTPTDDSTRTMLIESADTALYKAKESGRNRVELQTAG